MKLYPVFNTTILYLGVLLAAILFARCAGQTANPVELSFRIRKPANTGYQKNDLDIFRRNIVRHEVGIAPPPVATGPDSTGTGDGEDINDVPGLWLQPAWLLSGP